MAWNLSTINSLCSTARSQSVLIIFVHFLALKLSALTHPWCIERKLESCKLKEINFKLKLALITTKITGWPLERLRIKFWLSLMKQEQSFSVYQCQLGVRRKNGKRLSNRRGWVGRGWVSRGSWVVSLRSPMYTHHFIYTLCYS